MTIKEIQEDLDFLKKKGFPKDRPRLYLVTERLFSYCKFLLSVIEEREKGHGRTGREIVGG